jgi:hypothetical protein
VSSRIVHAQLTRERIDNSCAVGEVGRLPAMRSLRYSPLYSGRSMIDSARLDSAYTGRRSHQARRSRAEHMDRRRRTGRRPHPQRSRGRYQHRRCQRIAPVSPTGDHRELPRDPHDPHDRQTATRRSHHDQDPGEDLLGRGRGMLSGAAPPRPIGSGRGSR